MRNSGNDNIRVTALTLDPICCNEGCNNSQEDMPGIGVILRENERFLGIGPASDQQDCVSLRAGVAI